MKEWLCGLIHANLVFMRCWVLANTIVVVWHFVDRLVG